MGGGGTVSFVGSMALALGLRVGIVTSAEPEADLSALDGTAVVCLAQVGPAPFIRVFSKSDNRCLTLTSLHQV